MLTWRSVHLLASLVLLVLLEPVALLIPAPWGGRLLSLLTTGVMLAAVWWVAERSHHRLVALLLVVLAIPAFWVRDALHPLGALAWVAFCVYVIGQLFAAVLSRRIRFVDRILTAVSVYLLIGMTFAYLHLMIWRLAPAAYDFGERPPTIEPMVDMLYFSFVTMLTLGYGDVVPVDPFARMLTVLEALTGAFFLAILIARLVSHDEWMLGRDASSDGGDFDG